MLIMEKNYDSWPLNVSFDTQLLPVFFLPDGIRDVDIKKLEKIKSKATSMHDSRTLKEANRTQDLLLSNYVCVEFFKHLLQQGKISIKTTPTAYGEILYSDFFNSKIIEFIKNKNNDILQIISKAEIVSIIKKHFSNLSLLNILSLIDDVADFSTFTLDLRSISKPNKEIVRQIQEEIVEKIKMGYLDNGFKRYDAGFKFVNFPYEDILDNDLAKDICMLSESYRIDRKSLSGLIAGQQYFKRPIPIDEVNDCTIMAICSLLNLPLISEDSKCLSSNIEDFKRENKAFHSKKKSRVVIGEPFSPSGFISTFFKEEFKDYIKTFRIPQDIMEIDKRGLIKNTINEIVNSETLSLTGLKNATDEEKCRQNRERYNQAFDSVKNASECEFLSSDELFEDGEDRVEHIKDFVYDSRRMFTDVIQPQTINELMQNLKRKIADVEERFWKYDIERKNRTFTDVTKNNDLKKVLVSSKDCYYDLMVVMNYILKNCLYGKTKQDLSEGIAQVLHSYGIKYIVNNTGMICGIVYEGLIFQIDDEQQDRIENKHLSVEYNTDDLSDEMAFLIGTNSRTFDVSGVDRIFDIYLRHYIEKHPNRLFTDRRTFNDIKALIRSLNGDDNFEYNKRDIQICGLMGDFRRKEHRE
jgi:hypothetical protein